MPNKQMSQQMDFLPTNTITTQYLSYLESALFIHGDPLSIDDMYNLFKESSIHLQKKQIRQLLDVLKKRYAKAESGMDLLEFNGQYQLSTKVNNHFFIQPLLVEYQTKKLTKATMETLSIIAVRQPITKVELQQIRGVSCESALSHLQANGYIKELGRLDQIGRPIIYGTTDLFMRDFKISNLEELKDRLQNNKKSEGKQDEN